MTAEMGRDAPDGIERGLHRPFDPGGIQATSSPAMKMPRSAGGMSFCMKWPYMRWL